MSNRAIRPDKNWIEISENAEIPATRMFTSESYYRSFWDLAEHGVVLVDNNKQIIYANPFIGMIYERTKFEKRGHQYENFIFR